ncbi:acyl-CoA dehydrogenase family protein [Nocardia sp. NPDC024068]|uniref:acyl-CoA dehydrogenase family protein n=1 Tax=Nocardia sp. NPDC024068 TaxID=3157197 RepID=UPI0033DA9F91
MASELETEVREWAIETRQELNSRGEFSINGSPSDVDSRYVYKKMGTSGLIGVHWPTAVGGRDADIEQSIALEEELGYHWLPMCGFLLSVKTIGNALLRFGTEEQKSTLLPEIARGDLLFCQGFSEPGAGSDLASLRTRAVPADGGWRITGRKIWTSSATEADWIYVAARTDPDAPKHRGLSVFVVDMNEPGITPTKHDTFGGGNLGEVELVDVFVPHSGVVGEIDQGWSVLMGTMDFERVTSEKIGVVRWLLDNLEPLATDPAHRHALQVLQGEARAARLLGLETSRMLDRDIPASAPASMCKLSIALMMQKLAALASEIVGPAALIEGTDGGADKVLEGRIAAFARSSLATTIAGGASDIQRKVIAQRGLNLPRRPAPVS